MPADALRVRGLHNALNALAALALVRSLGLGWANMLHALRDYSGEPHRTEFVRTIGGVDFVNDSKGTNVGATVAALDRSEEHTSELQSLMRISYAVFCLKKKTRQ